MVLCVFIFCPPCLAYKTNFSPPPCLLSSSFRLRGHADTFCSITFLRRNTLNCLLLVDTLESLQVAPSLRVRCHSAVKVRTRPCNPPPPCRHLWPHKISCSHWWQHGGVALAALWKLALKANVRPVQNSALINVFIYIAVKALFFFFEYKAPNPLHRHALHTGYSLNSIVNLYTLSSL